jgi:hypothetical protein
MTPRRRRSLGLQQCALHACCVTGRGHAGLYFGGRQSQYFAVGKITQEQVNDYAERKGIPRAEAEQWLRTMLSYEP